MFLAERHEATRPDARRGRAAQASGALFCAPERVFEARLSMDDAGPARVLMADQPAHQRWTMGHKRWTKSKIATQTVY